jgi:hypothetical protein
MIELQITIQLCKEVMKLKASPSEKKVPELSSAAIENIPLFDETREPVTFVL